MKYDRAPAENIRSSIAAAVHAACDEVLPGGGLGRCHLVAVAGAAACSWATGKRYVPVGGGLRLLIDEPDGWFSMDPTITVTPQLEYHAWVVRLDDRGSPGVGPICEWVDFSSRHWKRLAASAMIVAGEYAASPDACVVVIDNSARILWTVADPPWCFWHGGRETPRSVDLIYNAATTRMVIETAAADIATVSALLDAIAAELRRRGLYKYGPS